jgi:hypothetical protein
MTKSSIGEVVPILKHYILKTYGEIISAFLTSAVDAGELSASRSGRFTSGGRSLVHGGRAPELASLLWRRKKGRHLPGSNHPARSLVITPTAIPALSEEGISKKSLYARRHSSLSKITGSGLYDRCSIPSSGCLSLCYLATLIIGYTASYTRRRYCLPVLAELISSTLKIETIFSSETSVETQRATRRHIPEDVTACQFSLNLFLPP